VSDEHIAMVAVPFEDALEVLHQVEAAVVHGLPHLLPEQVDAPDHLHAHRLMDTKPNSNRK